MREHREFLSYLNGQVMPHSQAVAALQQGSSPSSVGYYDTARTFGGRVFKLRQHLQRLYGGLKYSQIDPGLTIDEMERVTAALLEANRPLLGEGNEATVTQVVSVAPPGDVDDLPAVNVLIYCQPLDTSVFARSYLTGVKVATPDTYGLPQQVFPLITTPRGTITECKGATFIFAQGGRIKLPDRRNLLPGISMQTVLELAASLEIPVDEGEYTLYDVYQADEAFVCSTRFCLLPVASINGYRLRDTLPGTVTRRLLDAWRNLVGVDFVRQALDRLPPGDV